MLPFARTIMKLLQPPGSFFIVILLVVFLIKRKYPKTSKLLIVLTFSIFYLLSTSLVSNLLIWPLEKTYPPLGDSLIDVNAVVVLNAGEQDLSHIGLGKAPTSEAVVRLAHGIQVYNQTKGAHLVICGRRGGELVKAATDLGLRKEDLIWEDRSSNTYEGAINLKAILKEKRKIVLVTNARHMGRAIVLHEKVGFEVIPSPSHYSRDRIKINLDTIIPSASALWMSSEAVYEYLSRMWYILRSIFVPYNESDGD